MIGNTRDIIGTVHTIRAATAKIHDIMKIEIVNTGIGIAKTGILVPTTGLQNPQRTKNRI